MELTDVLGWLVLIVLVYVAFRVGAVVLKVVLGLLAIAVVVWLIQGLLAGAGAAALSVPLG
jgi:hypothetical protein